MEAICHMVLVGLSAMLMPAPVQPTLFHLEAECLVALEGGPVVLRATLTYTGAKSVHLASDSSWSWVTVRRPRQWADLHKPRIRMLNGPTSLTETMQQGGKLTEFIYIHHDLSTVPAGFANLRLECPVHEYVHDPDRNNQGRCLAESRTELKVNVHRATPENVAAVRRRLEAEFARHNLSADEWTHFGKWILNSKHEALLPLALRLLGSPANLMPWPIVSQVEQVSGTPEKARQLLLDHISGEAPACYPSVFDLWPTKATVLTRAESERLQECDAPWIRTLAYVTFPRHFPLARREELLDELPGNLPPRRAEQLRRLVADLDVDDFNARERASRVLERLAETADGPLREALAGRPSPEVRRRIEVLLAKLDQAHTVPESQHAFALLEHWATPEARQVLQAMARGRDGLWRTKEARAVLDRLARKP